MQALCRLVLMVVLCCCAMVLSAQALGFFSSFNPEIISFVTLYKGNIPAQFGGRLASVLDVELRDGSFQNYRVKGGVGLVSTKASLEGPVIKEKLHSGVSQ